MHLLTLKEWSEAVKDVSEITEMCAIAPVPAAPLLASVSGFLSITSIVIDYSVSEKDKATQDFMKTVLREHLNRKLSKIDKVKKYADSITAASSAATSAFKNKDSK